MENVRRLDPRQPARSGRTIRIEVAGVRSTMVTCGGSRVAAAAEAAWRKDRADAEHRGLVTRQPDGEAIAFEAGEQASRIIDEREAQQVIVAPGRTHLCYVPNAHN